MLSQPLAPGIVKILDELRKAKDLGRPGLRNKDLLETTGLSPSILSEYLIKLQDEQYIGRDFHKKMYHILDEGVEVLGARDTILIMSRDKKVHRKEIEPAQSALAPRFLPLDAAVYIGPEMEVLIDEAAQQTPFNDLGEPVTKKQTRDQIVDELAMETAGHFETMFLNKFCGIVNDHHAYLIQQMPGDERRKYLRGLYRRLLVRGRDVTVLSQSKAMLDRIEREWMRIPGSAAPPRFDKLLDFEGALVVSVSRDKLMKHAAKIQNRFTAFLLTCLVPGNELLPNLPHATLTTMAALGMITPEEVERLKRTKGYKAYVKALRELIDKYDELAWGPKKEKIGFATVRIPERRKKR